MMGRSLYLFCLLLLFVLCSFAEEETLTAKEWKEKGDEAFRLKSYDIATDYYTKAIDADPENYLYYYQRALVFTFRGRSNLAITDFDSVLSLNPKHVTSLVKRGQLHLENGQFDAAEEDFIKALELRSTSKSASDGLEHVRKVKAAVKIAENLTNEKKFEEAASAWEKVLEISPTTESYLLNRVECLIETKAYGDALSEAVRALRNNPKSMNILITLGKISALQGDFETAASYFKKAIKYDPEGSAVSKLLKSTKKILKVIRALEEAYQHERWTEVIEQFNAAVELNEQVWENYHLLLKQCKALVSSRKYTSGISVCTKALELDSESFDAVYWRGEAYLMQDDFQNARQDFTAARQANPNDRRAAEAFQRLERKEKMALRKDYYKIMGVPKDVTPAQLKKAYRKLALVNHPDKHPEEEKAHYEEIFQEITEAYEILSDEEKRGRYDRGEDIDVRQQGGNPFQGGFPGGFPGGFNFQFRYG